MLAGKTYITRFREIRDIQSIYDITIVVPLSKIANVLLLSGRSISACRITLITSGDGTGIGVEEKYGGLFPKTCSYSTSNGCLGGTAHSSNRFLNDRISCMVLTRVAMQSTNRPPIKPERVRHVRN